MHNRSVVARCKEGAGAGGARVWLQQDNLRGPLGDGDAPCLHGISVSILAERHKIM